jgi:hypothetical protein
MTRLRVVAMLATVPVSTTARSSFSPRSFYAIVNQLHKLNNSVIPNVDTKCSRSRCLSTRGGDSGEEHDSGANSISSGTKYTVLSDPAPGSPFHYAFPVHDLTIAKEFYGNILGCEEGRSSEKWQDYSLHGHQIVAHWVGNDYRCHDYYNPVDGDEVPVPRKLDGADFTQTFFGREEYFREMLKLCILLFPPLISCFFPHRYGPCSDSRTVSRVGGAT